MGPPLGVVALLGLGYALLRRRRADLILASQPLFVGGFLMLFATKEPQHMLVAFPALTILGAVFVVDGVCWLIRPRVWQTVALALVSILVLVVPATRSFQNSYRMTLPDTRSVAKDWIEANIPPGSRIVMDSGKYYLGALGPPLRLSAWTLEQFVDRGTSLDRDSLDRRVGSRRPGYSGEAEYFRQQLQALGDQPGYDVVQILHDVSSPTADVLTLDEYLAMGVQYAVVNSRVRNGYLPGGDEAAQYPDKAVRYLDFYQTLESRATLLKEFSSSDKMVGPDLRIYKLP
jgi:MYXO-CTERM domain-containing protein